MSKNAETCPGCHRHCSLASPRCRVGELYARKRARHEEMAREEAAAALAPAREDGGAALGKTLRRVSRALDTQRRWMHWVPKNAPAGWYSGKAGRGTPREA